MHNHTDYSKTLGSEEKIRIAKGYDEIARDAMGMDNEFHDRCVGMHDVYTGKILDVGCGSGHLLQKISETVRQPVELYGLDISQKLCDIAQKKNPDAKIVQGDAEALPYESNTFDVVFMTEALEHMLDYDKALSEVSRVLKPKGIFIVTVPNRDWASFDFYDKIRNKNKQPIDDHYFRIAEIKNHLHKNSFKILRYQGSDNLFYYAPYHKYEQMIARIFPLLHFKMKRIIFKCLNEKQGQ